MTLPNSQNASHGSRMTFVASLLLFIAAQLYLTAVPFFVRSAPVEPDDAYGYILKAEQIRMGCFWQDCLALNSLRSQIEQETNNIEVAYHRAREHQRLFSVYHPAHSVALLSLHAVGLSYENGYALIAIVGKFLLCLAIAYWLHALYGARTSAISLLILAPMTFAGQGLHVIVPSNLALGLALLAWAMTARHDGAKSIVVLVFLMLFTHPVGRLYAGITFGLTWLRWEPRPIKTTSLGLIGALLVGSFLLPFLIIRPQIEIISGSFYPLSWDLWQKFLEYLPNSLSLLNSWFSAFFNLPIGLSIFALGFLTLPPMRRKLWYQMFVLLLGLALLGLVYTTPWYHAVAFQRVWVPMGIFLLGLVGQLITTTVDKWWKVFKDLGERRELTSLLKPSLLLACLSIMLLAVGFYNYIPFHFRHYVTTLNNMIDRANIDLNAAQPTKLFSQRDTSTVLYTDELNLYYFLTYGGFSREAIYLPAIFNAENEAEWLQRENLDYVVLTNSKEKLTELNAAMSRASISSSEMNVFDSQGYWLLLSIR